MAITPSPSGVSAVRRQAEDTIRTLFDYLTAQGQADYIGEAISQLEHSLQCAHRASEAHADPETIIGALLHDVGRFIPNSDYDRTPAMIAPDGNFVGRASHEVLGERYLRDLGFSDKVCELVGGHVVAKRYLTATDDSYYAARSKSSKVSLKYQASSPKVHGLIAGRPFHTSAGQGGRKGLVAAGKAQCAEMGRRGKGGRYSCARLGRVQGHCSRLFVGCVKEVA